MSYIKFDKNQLTNPDIACSTEFLEVNHSGCFLLTTLANCNTRKYHGLFITPIDNLQGENHILLSTVDEIFIDKNTEYKISTRCYPFKYEPQGYYHLESFELNPVPTITLSLGKAIIKKEILICQNDPRTLIRYTLVKGPASMVFKLRPFLTFRNIHQLTYSNYWVNKKFRPSNNGIVIKLYNEYPDLFLQLSQSEFEYIHVPDWYFKVEYPEELKRGYPYNEDLYTPGFFEIPLKKNTPLIFSAGTLEANSANLKNQFTSEIKKYPRSNNFEQCLSKAAQQFIIRRNSKTQLIAGYPWFGQWGRDTFISLPGLTLALNDKKTCEEILDSITTQLSGALFPNMGNDTSVAYNSVDAPLWFCWAVQQYADYIKSNNIAWQKYGKHIKTILYGYKNGTNFNIKKHSNGLIYAGSKDHALTWMDAMVNGKSVTPRTGYCVEINALWYNAICFALEAAKSNNDTEFINDFKKYPPIIEHSFVNVFWDANKGYLADCATETKIDWSIRPNQIFAASLPFSPIDNGIKKILLATVQKHLLTPKGLRTLSPEDKNYIGIYEGNQEARDKAYHQGTVWTWLIGHLAEAWLKVAPSEAVPTLTNIINGFEDDMKQHCIGTISEIYYGDPPHKPCGAISQAWSVAEIIRTMNLLRNYKNSKL